MTGKGTAGADLAALQARLRDIIAERSLLRGEEIKLSSGRTSRFYFDMKRTTFQPEAAGLIARLLLDAIRDEPVDYLGGLEMGAVPLVACACQASWPDRPLRGFFVRKQPKEHGTRRSIEGLKADESLAGRTVVVIEDVTTTAGSAIKAIEAAQAEGARVRTVVTVVDRLEGAAANLDRRGIALKALLTADDFAL